MNYCTAIGVLVALCASTRLLSVEAAAIPPLDAIAEEPMADELTTVKPGVSDRVRIAIQMTSFYRTTVRDAKGDLKMTTLPGKPDEYVLRARIDRPNHFYFGGWHFEAIPQVWNQPDHRYKTKLHVSKRFGQVLTEVEETIGVIDVSGTLAATGEKHIFEFVSSGPVTKFNDREGFPFLEVRAGKPVDATRLDTSPPVALPPVAQKQP